MKNIRKLALVALSIVLLCSNHGFAKEKSDVKNPNLVAQESGSIDTLEESSKPKKKKTAKKAKKNKKAKKASG